MEKAPLNKFIHNYQLKPNIKQKYRVTHDILITNSTIKKYCQYHQDVEEKFYTNIKSTLQKIRKSEKAVKLDNTTIYFHTYRILFWIDLYQKALDFFNSNEYKKFSFAKYASKNKKIEDEFFRLQKESLDPYFFTGTSRLRMKILQLFLENRDLVDLVLNTQTLIPKLVIKYEALENYNANIMTTIQKIFDHFASSYISSEDVILKSLSIVLYSYLTFHMKIKTSYAKGIVQEIMQELFNYDFQSISNQNIYIAGRLNNLPIFKNSSKNEIYSEQLKHDFTVFSKYIQRGFTGLDYFDLNPEKYFNENPIKAYFEQYPIEFMDKID